MGFIAKSIEFLGKKESQQWIPQRIPVSAVEVDRKEGAAGLTCSAQPPHFRVSAGPEQGSGLAVNEDAVLPQLPSALLRLTPIVFSTKALGALSLSGVGA